MGREVQDTERKMQQIGKKTQAQASKFVNISFNELEDSLRDSLFLGQVDRSKAYSSMLPRLLPEK